MKPNKQIEQMFDIDHKVMSLVSAVEKDLKAQFAEVDELAEINQFKVLKALQDNKLADMHFNWNTGYGYDDNGRDVTEKIFAQVFGGEVALVRTNFVNGTHALSTALFGVLRPGDQLIYCSGSPYDTLEEVIGTRGEGMGSLKEYGVKYDEVPLVVEPKANQTSFDYHAIKKAINEDTRVCAIQRATGYASRRAITIEEIRDLVKFIKAINSEIIIFVDNCYGEFLNVMEPLDVGCDLMAGSLIKNPGGGLALSGGYVCGKKDLVDLVSYRLTCPGIGGECGLTYGQTRAILQGLFLAPAVVASAVKGAILCGKVYDSLGFTVFPKPADHRSDIIQSVSLGSEEGLIAFCEGIQAAAPVDSFVTPMPWPMPGYDSDVVMAAGAFVQGSSIELSADGPMREPYNVYFQGGLTYAHSKFGVIKSLDSLVKKGLVSIG